MEIHLPGYVCYRKKGENPHRGGSAVLLKNAVADQISYLRIPSPECILLSLRHLPNTLLATCYVPPADSPYHSFAPIAEIQAELSRNPLQHVIIIGDLNARFSKARTEFIEGKDLPDHTTYTNLIDTEKNANSNARYLMSALHELILINGLSTQTKKFPADLTYRKGTKWVSELDSCLTSPALIPAIIRFDVNQSTRIPSDHAPISLSLSIPDIPRNESTYLVDTFERSVTLGVVQEEHRRNGSTQKPVRMANVDPEGALQLLTALAPPSLDDPDVDRIAEDVNNMLYNCAATNRKEEPNQPHATTEQRRWKNLLENNDPKTLWKAINWNGCLEVDDHQETPTDDAFQAHFESLLNPPDAQVIQVPDSIYLPITDDPITPEEVDAALHKLKQHKSGGPSGVPPGLLKILPANWIVFLASFFSLIMHQIKYPHSWTYTKLITIFKKGTRLSCDNYRGISLMDSLAKVYDCILNRRLNLWFKPDREQAGAQKGRGCLEHLLTLRLLIDSARHKKRKLYVIFVDFSKAYDRVPRATMLSMMRNLGCGTTMLRAIAAAYQTTQAILRTAIITSSIGVRQGSPSSCLLFTLLVNQLIRDFKEKCPHDGFLKWLHCLLLMDDAVIFATTRQRALEKIQILQEFCTTTGMVINQGKTKFMTINGTEQDHLPLEKNSLTIENCNKYCYLGAVITQDASIASSVKAQCEAKRSHVIKYEAYVRKNADMPFPAKKKVFDAALTTAILYSCETWLSPAACNAASSLYAACIRTLLGVRKTTATDLCLIEIGVPSLSQFVRTAQKKTIGKMVECRRNLPDDPFTFALSVAQESRCPAARYITSLETYDPLKDTEDLHARVRQSARTKFTTYVGKMNPTLSVHDMYALTDTKESQRLTVTRVRLSSHNLAIERGRWNRTPREERLCTCGAIQDEPHISAQCPNTQEIRDSNPDCDFSFPAIMNIIPPRQMLPIMTELFSTFV